MKISRLIIKNYRNLKDIDICLGETVVLIGENNSGKSNLLRAVTLPFLTDESSFSGKSLSWIDINDTAKEKYYHYIIENQKSIVDGTIKCADFIKEMPVVNVEVQLKADVAENYFVKDLSYSVENGELVYGLRYEYRPSKADEIFKLVKHVLTQETVDEISIKKVKMNLLPTEFYTYSITVPDKGSVAYDTLKLYKYTALEAERDEFSRTKERLGSKSLVKVLQMGLSDDDKLKVEKEYNHFFEELKTVSKMDHVINWQEESELEDAKEFFEHISILPNMPPMQTILNSIRLGYSDAELTLQGLGYRNLILLLVLINSLMGKKNDVALNILTIEEPEAHLHPQLQELVHSFLEDANRNDSNIQIIYTSHSPTLASKIDIENINLIYECGHEKFCLPFSEAKLNEDNKKYLQRYLDVTKSQMFFARGILFVEGNSEAILIPEMAKALDRPL